MPRGSEHTCKRCGWVWQQRLPARPRRCANQICRSPYWDTEPRLGHNGGPEEQNGSLVSRQEAQKPSPQIKPHPQAGSRVDGNLRNHIALSGGGKKKTSDSNVRQTAESVRHTHTKAGKA